MATVDLLTLVPVLNEISAKQNIPEPQIEYKYKSEKGDGYLGLINAVDIVGNDGSNLSLILKTASNNEKFRKQTPVADVFLREIYFYDTIWPEFQKFQNSVPIKFTSVPRCLATVSANEEELIVLENLKSQGYTMWDRTKCMSDECLEFVFREYGKFHAVSFAMKEKDPDKFKALVKNMDDLTLKFIDQVGMMKMFFLTFQQLETLFDLEEEAHYSRVFTDFADNIEANIRENLQKGDYPVIVHGDCWCNNMMFKFTEGSSTPEAMRLIDFQIVKLSSPVSDLSYFFYSCASKQSMQRLNHFLKVYYDSLSSFLMQFGCDPAKIFPYSALWKEWKRFSKHGAIMSTVIIKVMVSDRDEVPDLANSAEQNISIADAFNFSTKYEEVYRSRVKDVIEHFIDRGFM